MIPKTNEYDHEQTGQIKTTTSMRMLAELGMGDSPQALTDQALKCGATINELGRLCFSRDMVEDIIDGACKSFVFHGRDEKYSFEVRRHWQIYSVSPVSPIHCRTYPGLRVAVLPPIYPISSSSTSIPLIA
jgi:trimethylamine:corrinoid methyltransferase-like protein